MVTSHVHLLKVDKYLPFLSWQIFSCVNGLMRLQVTGLSEGLAACLTDMRFLPRMRPHVYIELTGPQERLVARLTDICLIPRMRPYVHIEVAGCHERLATRLANM